jgi:hypothetical protein
MADLLRQRNEGVGLRSFGGRLFGLADPRQNGKLLFENKARGTEGDDRGRLFRTIPLHARGKVIKETPSPAVPADPRNFALVFAATSVVAKRKSGKRKGTTS